MPPPLGFNLAPRAHAPGPSLSLARSRPGPPGPPSLSGASATSASSSTKPVSPRAPSFHAELDDSSIPLLPVTPVDPAAWAAEHARPSNDIERVSGEGRRVQFAPDTHVAVFDVEDEEEAQYEGFQKLTREEVVWIAISVAAVGGIGAAAVLATLYDWVL
ncbi:hypothetical protein CC85DRAFT_285705 [Cutaneotrichosporon oleaginosum]|uniref:Uncharacterized protein n=1 Tax=Cutaneotrichosporon oleaginosum TaxID=879819 RepID=A0A0J0XMJ2_9TREE|nr:uncharacterized protein CC85DRAFT_285705 [Cutaneotrichosporon oleaginosum]KLT42302.1 hypothetical protein CC85DRAFT_285705 [Cutaneotrichosporon oleaginosum]TXT11474.1 hypothetical protein COLE_01884 [Cutaneotrichosporon oleaginosum]